MAEAEARDERSTRRAYTFGTNQRQLRASIHGRFPMGMRAEQATARIRGSIGLIESSGEEIAGEEISRRKQAGAGAGAGAKYKGEEREASRAPGSRAGLAFPCGAD